MAISLSPEHLSRYKDIARLLVRHGRSDVLHISGLDEVYDDAEAGEDAADLASDLEDMGPTFIKLGQILSTRSDLLPPPYLKELSRLQDHCRPVAFDAVRETVEAELGVRLSNGFDVFDEEPLASASLGQVHRAVLRGGREVAVKVLRPGIEEQARVDLEALMELAEFVDRRTKTGERFRLAAMVEEFRRTMLGELDLLREAANLRHLARDMAGFERIVVPQPVRDYTTARVLTMDYLAGRKITDIKPVGMLDLPGEELAEALFDAYLHQILVAGFFHADPHPGNVLVTDDERLALLDLGMVARLQPELQNRIARLLVAASEGDGPAAADQAVDLGKPLDSFDRDGFERRVSDLVAQYHEARLEEVAAGSIVVELTRIAGDCGLRPAPELAMLGKTLLNLDELARRLSPSFDPNAALRRRTVSLFEQQMRRGLSPGSLLAGALEAKEFAERLPGRVNKVMDTLAEGEVRLQVRGIDEREFIRGAQKVANRVTMGLILAALIVGAAMLTRVETAATLFGYPTIAILCFMVAAAGGMALMVSILVGDRRDR